MRGRHRVGKGEGRRVHVGGGGGSAGHGGVEGEWGLRLKVLRRAARELQRLHLLVQKLQLLLVLQQLLPRRQGHARRGAALGPRSTSSSTTTTTATAGRDGERPG